jgi:pimeloyl-ACP methyl ester carboxylesterase
MAIRSMVTGEADQEKIIGWSKQSDRATVVNAMADLMGDDLRQDVGRIKAPVLVLGTWIAYKDFVPRSAVEATYRDQYKHLPNVTIDIADKARHFIMYDDPAWMFERVERFLTL